MSTAPPTGRIGTSTLGEAFVPPTNLPKYLREGLQKQSSDRLRRAAEYAEALADHKEAEAKQQLEGRANQSTDEVPEEWEDQENE